MKKKINNKIPDIVHQNLIAIYGDYGSQWLANLPKFISHYENEWKFKAGECFSDAQFNVVLNSVRNDDFPVVFKCSVPNKEFKTEVKALEHYNGIGAVKLLKCDIDNGAMLIEKINPGTLLEKCNSIEEATRHAVLVCKKIHKPINDESLFPTLTDWFENFDKRLYKKFNGTSGPFSESLISKAHSISDELLNSQSNTILLHGDLHYANLLLMEDNTYTAIDAKGVHGEREFEIPLPRASNSISKKELLYRLDCFIEQSEFDKNRIYSWLFSKSVLATWWTVEDSGSRNELTSHFLNVANRVENFL